jgi:hypothetical protein
MSIKLYMTKKDIDRKEEKWGNRNEIYMRHLIILCGNKSAQHDRAGYHFKKINSRLGLPMVLIPVIMSPVSVLVEGQLISRYANATAFIITGILSATVNFYKYGEKMSNHFNYSTRFADIKTDLEVELVKERPYRNSYDVFSTKMHMRIDSLLNGSPTLPKHIADDCNYKISEFDYKNFKEKHHQPNMQFENCNNRGNTEYPQVLSHDTSLLEIV